FTILSSAQIIDAYDSNIITGEIEGAYYKDVNNFRQHFVGTWVYSQGSTQLTIAIQKRDNLVKFNGLRNYNIDVLVGEYRYVENGVEKINTLPNINNNYGTTYRENKKHNLFGWLLLRRSTSFPRCNECEPNEKRIEFSYNEPNYDGMGVANGHLVVRPYLENGIEKIKVWFYTTNN
ncbi:DUF6705 family protein, partial [Flavobacterium sp. j3]